MQKKRKGGGFEAVRTMALQGAAKEELNAIHRIIGDMESFERQAIRARVLESAAGTTNTVIVCSASEPCSTGIRWPRCTI